MRALFLPLDELHRFLGSVVGFQQAQNSLALVSLREQRSRGINMHGLIANASNRVEQDLAELNQRMRNARIGGRPQQPR